MIHISEEDRDALRFLWLQDPLDPRSTVVHFRFTRLVFGLRPSPAILGSVISNHLSSTNMMNLPWSVCCKTRFMSMTW